MGNAKDTAQYVISLPYKRGRAKRLQPTVASVIDALTDVRVLSRLDDSVVLVEMTAEVRERITREYPELTVELNTTDYRRA